MCIFIFGLTASCALAATVPSAAQTAAPGTTSVGASVSVTTNPPPAPPPPPETQQVAPTNESTLDRTFTAFGAVGYGYGFGAAAGFGGRYQWVAIPKGFLRLSNGIHDEFAVEPGFDYFRAGYSIAGGYDVTYNEFTPLTGFVWNVWLNDHLLVYPKIDVGYRLFAVSESLNGVNLATFTTDYAPIYFQGAAGVAYKFGSVSLRAEVGWEALRAGIALSL
jgi:hypothetical protein